MTQYALWGMPPTKAKAVPKPVPESEKRCQTPVPKAVPIVHAPTPYVVGGGSAHPAEFGTGWHRSVKVASGIVLKVGRWTRYRVCPECDELQPPNAMRTFLAGQGRLRRCCMFCGHWGDGDTFERITE